MEVRAEERVEVREALDDGAHWRTQRRVGRPTLADQAHEAGRHLARQHVGIQQRLRATQRTERNNQPTPVSRTNISRLVLERSHSLVNCARQCRFALETDSYRRTRKMACDT